MRRLLIFTTALAAGLLLGPPGQAFAGTITFTNTYSGSSGTGFGSIDNVLTLQANNQSGSPESGGVAWGGGPQDVLSGDAKNTSQTLLASYLTSAGGTNISWSAATGADFVVIFQVNQQGTLGSTSVDLSQFQIDFFKADGSTALASVEYSGPTLTLAGTGVGSSGWIFNVHLDGTEASTFFGTGTNRLGMSVSSSSPISNWNDGPENFYIAAGEGVLAAPEPGSVALLGMGVLSLVGFGLRRRMLTARGA
jgi:hypothetical protein